MSDEENREAPPPADENAGPEGPDAAAEGPDAAPEGSGAAAEGPDAAPEGSGAAQEVPDARSEPLEPSEPPAEIAEEELTEERAAEEVTAGAGTVDAGTVDGGGAAEAGTVDAGGAAEVELPPRERPEIPGADLIPDIVPEADEFLDAEARAAAEAEAEARAAREREQRDQEETQPIADAAIDLAAGARYTATGKRKTAVARVILKPGDGTYAINGKPLDSYFPRETLRRVIRQPLEAVGYDARMDVVARMHGGGVSAQSEALRHGISRALIVADPHLRGELKRRGFLTRDPRVKERKKAGLKKARKRPQFSKR